MDNNTPKFELNYCVDEWKELRYYAELKRSMNYLADHSATYFMGQSITTRQGNAMRSTLVDIPKDKILEMPVMEDVQLGMSTGMALSGFIPVSIYRCWNFFLLATNQLVNHLDKLKEMSRGQYQPKVIMRVGVGSERPLYQGAQHSGDLTDGYRLLLTNTEVIRLDEPDQIFPAYEKALNRTDGKSTLLIEWLDFYAEK